MELRTQLNQDRFCWIPEHKNDLDNRAYALVEIETPAVRRSEHVTPTNLVAVLDRSGSMDGAPIDYAKRALCDVVDRLSPTDNFGLVIFDTEVDVVVAAGSVRDRAAIKAAINSVFARGGTDLSSGLIRGLKEARRLEALAGARVLLISDGHANVGVTDPSTVGNLVATYLDHRITTSSLGMGMGFDERL
ncbi:MAG: vWA domain-containing protein, partial [Aeromicrobium sp.]